MPCQVLGTPCLHCLGKSRPVFPSPLGISAAGVAWSWRRKHSGCRHLWSPALMLRPLEHDGLDSLHSLCPAHLLGALLPASQNKSSRREGSGSLRSFDALQQPFTSAFSEDFPNDVTAPLKVSFASFVPCSSLPLKRPEILLFPRDSESIRSRREARDCQAPPVVRVLYKSLGSGLTKDSGVSLLFLRGRSFSARQRRYPLKGSWVPRLWRELLFSPSSPLRPTHRVK